MKPRSGYPIDPKKFHDDLGCKRNDMPLRGDDLSFQEDLDTGFDDTPRSSVRSTRATRRMAATRETVQVDDSSDDQMPRSSRNRAPSTISRGQPVRRRGKQNAAEDDDDDELSDSPDISKYIKTKEVCDLIEGWTTTVKDRFQKKYRIMISLFDGDGERFVLLRGSDTADVDKAKKDLIEMAREESSEELGEFSKVLEVPTDVCSSKIVLRKMRDVERDTNTSIQRKQERASGKKLTHVTVMADVQADLDDAVAELSIIFKNALKSARRNKPKPSVISFAESDTDEYVEAPTVAPPVPVRPTPEPVREVEVPVDPVHKKYPGCMNILVLGETGVGKSTFINGLVNYLQYSSMQEALNGGVSILIESAFNITDENCRSTKIETKSTIPDENGSNEVLGKGQSATQYPKAYVFQWGEGADAKSIRIIDTPGIGDTRGLEQDKENFENILSFLADYDEIHGILILVKPNTARLTVAFRFCIDELLVHLHRSASKNLLFCFTNTRSTLYKPGDTLPTLIEHLEKLEKDRGIVIPLNKSTLFSFDNEAFRFLCAHMSQFPFTDAERVNFEGSWSMSTKESLRLFDRICELPVHKVNETLCLNNTRSAIISLSRPLAEIARNQMINTKLIEEKMKEIKNHAKEGDDLRSKLYVDQIVLTAEELPYPVTVCTGKDCVTHSRVGSNSNAPLQTIYTTICHEHCYLNGVQTENCPNAALQNCWAMNKTMNCRVCGCLWSTHMHITYKMNETMIQVVDKDVENSIKNKDSAVKTINLFLAKQQKKVNQLKADSAKITEYCAEFASFLSANSIRPYNDSYKQYIEHLIKEEQEKVGSGGTTEVLRRMEEYRDQYEEQTKLLDTSLKNTVAPPRSVSHMNRMVSELKSMKHGGSMLTDIQGLQVLSVRSKQKYTDKNVPIKNGWFSTSTPRRVYNNLKSMVGY